MAILHVRDVPDDLYEQIRRKAQAERRSISGEVILLLERAIVTPEAVEHDPAYAEFLRRQQALRRQAVEWYQARAQPMSQEAYDQVLAKIDEHRERLRERYGTMPDSTAILREDRARDERRW